MVYCGKPSKACEACRAKRTKCDLALPICGQCRRAHRTCNYRVSQDLVFRNETDHVVNKAQTSKASLSSTSKFNQSLPENEFNEAFNDFSEPSSNVPLVNDIPPVAHNSLISRSLVPSIEDQASSFFFHHFVTEGSNPPSTYSIFLPTLFNHESNSGSACNPLPGVITSIGMAGLSNMQSSSVGMVATRQKHTTALRALTAALQDPEASTADSTMMAVMLLGTFEQVTCTAPQALKSWANHISGAMAIAQARGQYQVQSDVGRSIFSHLRNQMMIDCFQRDKAIPPEFMEWADRTLEFDSSKTTQREVELFQIVARLCNLRSLVHRSKESSLRNPLVLSLAKEIDSDLVEFANAFPARLGYTTKCCKVSENVLSDYYHVYPNTWIVTAWSLIRTARIMTHELIWDWLSQNPNHENLAIQRRESEMLLTRLNADICASVPYILGDLEPEDGVAVFPRAAGGLAMVWPLYLCATMDTVTQSTRDWVITRLDKLGHMMGIQQAVTLAHVLRTQRHITAWARFESTRPDEEIKEW